jgi:hypothetical protein
MSHSFSVAMPPSLLALLFVKSQMDKAAMQRIISSEIRAV